jgi:hypothetical protein
MKLFKNVSMSIWDIGLVKFAISCMALGIGSTWPNIFAPYATPLFIVGILVGLFSLYSWIKK